MLKKFLVIVLGLAFLGSFAVAEADGRKGELVLRVDTNGFADFDMIAPNTDGIGFPFYVSGNICQSKVLGDICDSIGVFHCWGWDTGNGLAVVSQEFDLWGKGKIQVQGVEDEGPRAVTGGTGKFRNVRGQANGFDFSNFLNDPVEPDGEFIVTFKLTGAKHTRDDDDSDSDD